MHEMVFAVRDEMQVAYPELKETAERVAKVVLAEEQQFARVVEVGAVRVFKGDGRASPLIPGGVFRRARWIAEQGV